MTMLKNPRTVAIATTVLCIASLLWLVSAQKVNSSLQSTLEQEKLRSEALLSEKLLLEKDVAKVKDHLTSLRGINAGLDEVVKAAEAKLAAREQELGKLRKQNASVPQLRKQREELMKMQHDLEQELLAVRSTLTAMQHENHALSQTIAQLQEQNSMLNRDLNRAMIASLDRFQIQTVKGKKERLTVRARKTDKLIAAFEVPASLTNLTFRIIDEEGKALSSNQGTIVSRLIPSEKNLVASTQEGQLVDAVQKVEMEYLPKKRLQSGVYTVEILNDNLYVGSVNVKLR